MFLYFVIIVATTLQALHKLRSAMSKSSLRVLVSSPSIAEEHMDKGKTGCSFHNFPQSGKRGSSVPQPGITTKAACTTPATDPAEVHHQCAGVELR